MAKRVVPPGQKLIFKMRIEPTKKATRSALKTAFDKVAVEMESSTKTKISRQGPPPSAPRTYPKKKSGLLHDTFEVTRKGFEFEFRAQAYALPLEVKAPLAGGRPFISRNIIARKEHWAKRIAVHAKEAMKTKR